MWAKSGRRYPTRSRPPLAPKNSPAGAGRCARTWLLWMTCLGCTIAPAEALSNTRWWSLHAEFPIVTSASWALAQGDPARVPKESIIRHRPLAQEQRAIFEYDVQFAAMEGNLVRALQALASLPHSKWSVRPLAKGGRPGKQQQGL